MEHGTVTSVTYEDGSVVCDVQSTTTGATYSDRPLLRPASSFIYIPEQGDSVAMEQLSDGTRMITQIIEKKQNTPDAPSSGGLVIQLDGNTKVSFDKVKGAYDVTLSASGDLTIDADGDVIIDGIDFDKHTHNYEDDNGDGTSTKTTKKPQ